MWIRRDEFERLKQRIEFLENEHVNRPRVMVGWDGRWYPTRHAHLGADLLCAIANHLGVNYEEQQPARFTFKKK